MRLIRVICGLALWACNPSADAADSEAGALMDLGSDAADGEAAPTDAIQIDADLIDATRGDGPPTDAEQVDAGQVDAAGEDIPWGEGEDSMCAVGPGRRAGAIGRCPRERPLDCGAHGECILRDLPGAQPECQCEARWAGERCGVCAEGYAEREGRCEDPCTIAGAPCGPNLHCDASSGAPRCVCDRTRTGEACDRCAEGWMPGDCADALCCVPDCAGACAVPEVCVYEREAAGPSCACNEVYGVSAGECAWPGFLTNGDFSGGCEGWTLGTNPGNDYPVVAAIVGERLHLRVERVCSTAHAQAPVAIPYQATVPDQALRMRVRGTPGAEMEVHLESRFFHVIGTGEVESVVECLRNWTDAPAGQDTLVLAVEAMGACGADDLRDFWVDDIELISDPACASR